MTLSVIVNQTLKWLSSLPILMQESFWWRQCSVRYSLPLPPPPGISASASTTSETTRRQTRLSKSGFHSVAGWWTAMMASMAIFASGPPPVLKSLPSTFLIKARKGSSRETCSNSLLLYVHRDHKDYLGTGSQGRPPRLSHSS